MRRAPAAQPSGSHFPRWLSPGGTTTNWRNERIGEGIVKDEGEGMKGEGPIVNR
jgi:hypothetical protein